MDAFTIESYKDARDKVALIKVYYLELGVVGLDVDHVAHCTLSMIGELDNTMPCGGFSKAIIGNDLRSAVFKADEVNIKYLKQYVYFLQNRVSYRMFLDYWKKNEDV